jgi:RNase P/RNase MRP subunit POP5
MQIFMKPKRVIVVVMMRQPTEGEEIPACIREVWPSVCEDLTANNQGAKILGSTHVYGVQVDTDDLFMDMECKVRRALCCLNLAESVSEPVFLHLIGVTGTLRSSSTFPNCLRYLGFTDVRYLEHFKRPPWYTCAWLRVRSFFRPNIFPSAVWR